MHLKRELRARLALDDATEDVNAVVKASEASTRHILAYFAGLLGESTPEVAPASDDATASNFPASQEAPTPAADAFTIDPNEIVYEGTQNPEV